MKHGSKSFIFFLLFASPACAASLSAAQLAAQISQNGASSVVSKLNAGSGSGWSAVIAHIATGAPAWLALAPKLAAGADAGTGEDLTSAMAAALLKNASDVLKLTGAAFPIPHICADPQIEPTDAQVAAWKERAFSALIGVNNPDLAAKIQACRAAIANE